MPKSFKATGLLGLSVPVLAALVYLVCAPRTVQNLDSGEMVANSYGLFVIHPPGYPLFTWLMFLATHLPVGTAFFRASVATTLFSAATLALITRLGRTRALGTLALAAALAFTPVYWRYSILPDVFMLHLFFCALLAYLYVEHEPSLQRLWLMALTFGLASGNHQTILFCLPMLLHGAWQTKALSSAMPWRRILLPLVTGASLTALLYLSLLLLHTGSLNSWGHLQTLGDVWGHFLRREFGTFQISGHEESHFSWAPLLLFASTLIASNPLSLLLVIVSIFVARRDSQVRILLFCVLISIFGLIPFANLNDAPVVERFFLMPIVLCVILAVTVWNRLSIRARAFALCAGAITLTVSAVNTLPQLPALNYAHDTIVEDYAQNLLRMVEDQKRPVILVQGDTRTFALRYAQVVQGYTPKAVVISIGIAFDQNQLDKIRTLYPEYKIDADWDSGANARSIPDHMLLPNISKFDFLTSSRINHPAMQTIFMGLGRRLLPGTGKDSVAPESLALIKRRTLIDPAPSLEPNEKREMYSEYAFAYLKLGMKAQDPQEQVANFNKALDVVPYCWPALANICVINEKLAGHVDTDCRARLTKMKAQEFNYY